MSAALEQPKKPVGGSFGVFMSENRPKFLEACKGKTGKCAAIKMGGEAWKSISEAEKAQFQEKYEAKMAQFKKDMAAFIEAGGEKTKGAQGLRRERKRAKEGKAKDANATRKPTGGGFGVFLAENRATITKKCAGLPAVAVTKEASTQWQALSDEAKKPFQDKFLIKMEEYKAASEEYKANLPEEDSEADEEVIDAVVSPLKKRKSAEGSDNVMDDAKKEGLHIKLKAMLENPKISSKGSQFLLDALREAGGKVADAKRAILSAK